MRSQCALRLLSICCPFRPVEIWQGGDRAGRISDRGRRRASKFERISWQATHAGIDMGSEKRAFRIIENVERRAGTWIDFDQCVSVVLDEKVERVETEKPACRRNRLCRLPQLSVHLRRNICRPQNTAESKGLAWRWSHPLAAQSNY